MEIVGLEDKTNAQIRELLKNGGRVVYFTYTISMIFFTQTKSSSLFILHQTKGVSLLMVTNIFSYLSFLDGGDFLGGLSIR